jgi:hypothetical protein
MKDMSLPLLLVLTMTLGCGQEVYKSKSGGAPQTEIRGSVDFGGEEGKGGRPADKPQSPPSSFGPTQGRKIKYTAEVHLVVNDFDKAEHELVGLVKTQQGYLAESEVNGSSGAPRAGRWRIRIPVDHFESFLEAVRQLGVPQLSRTDSEDVTAQFVDLEARLKSKKDQEEALRGYLKEHRPKSELKDILAIEQEMARVRGEIEQLEGQIRLLTNLTSLTTITVQVQEIKNYVPPQTPTFASTIGQTFDRSLDALIAFGKGCVLVAVAITPWLPLALLLVPVWLLLRREHRLRSPTPAPDPRAV